MKNDIVLGGVWYANDSTECVIYSVRAVLVWMRLGEGDSLFRTEYPESFEIEMSL